MNIAIDTLDGIALVRVEGVVDRAAAGRLYDSLVSLIEQGRKKVIVDLSGTQSITRAGVRGIVVAARMLRSPHCLMRLCGAGPGVDGFIKGLGYDHLLKCDPDIAGSVLAIAFNDGRPYPYAGWSASKDRFAAHRTSNDGYPLIVAAE